MKRTCIKRGVWHLGGIKKTKKNKKKGGFLHILRALARPLLVSAAGAVGGEVLKGLYENLFFPDGNSELHS